MFVGSTKITEISQGFSMASARSNTEFTISTGIALEIEEPKVKKGDNGVILSQKCRENIYAIWDEKKIIPNKIPRKWGG